MRHDEEQRRRQEYRSDYSSIKWDGTESSISSFPLQSKANDNDDIDRVEDVEETRGRSFTRPMHLEP
jgi:hypothetical protein